jgi:hypothetical protein
MRKRHKIDYSFWRNLRQDGCRQAKLYIDQLPCVMGVCPERDPRALLIHYLQETVTKILAVCITIDLDGSLAVSASRMSNSAMAALSSKLPFCIAAISLTFRNLRLGFGPLVGRKRSTDIYSLAEGAIWLTAHVAFVARMRLNQFPFTF